MQGIMRTARIKVVNCLTNPQKPYKLQAGFKQDSSQEKNKWYLALWDIRDLPVRRWKGKLPTPVLQGTRFKEEQLQLLRLLLAATSRPPEIEPQPFY